MANALTFRGAAQGLAFVLSFSVCQTQSKKNQTQSSHRKVGKNRGGGLMQHVAHYCSPSSTKQISERPQSLASPWRGKELARISSGPTFLGPAWSHLFQCTSRISHTLSAWRLLRMKRCEQGPSPLKHGGESLLACPYLLMGFCHPSSLYHNLSVCLHIVFPLHLSTFLLLIKIPYMIRAHCNDLTLMITSVKTLFPNKVTF